MKICVLGGDGFCGWPTSLYLSSKGHDITIVDNLSRRDIDSELSVDSLTPIASVSQRIQAWKECTGSLIQFVNLDLSKDYCEFLALVTEQKYDAIIHFAEQRAAPYSMKNAKTKRYTVDNNLNATNNVLCAIVESGLDIHLVHLGTMGVYGYGTAGMKIPEGYLNVKLETDEGEEITKEIVYPPSPGSIYHLTKTQDALFFQYYNNNDKVRITDLHQGVVWGTQTEQTALDDRLINRFDYDGDYGTVLNRFVMQAALGYPLTVHGTGGQTRAFIHIKDTVKCVELALLSPPEKGERVQIFNQMTETHRVIDLAKLVSELSGVKYEFLENPRNEDSENELHVENKCFLDLGLVPTRLSQGLLTEINEIAAKYRKRCDLSKIVCTSTWVKK